MIPGYEDDPLADGSEFLNQPLFWPYHLKTLLHDPKAQELAFGPDWDAVEELSHELMAPTSWPVFTVPVGNGCEVRVVYRNFEGDMGVDYLLHDPARSTALRLATDEGCFQGPGLSWRELNAVSPDHSPRRGSGGRRPGGLATACGSATAATATAARTTASRSARSGWPLSARP